MRSHAKAATSGSTQCQAGGLGRIFRGALAIRGASGDADGSGAPSHALARHDSARRLVFAIAALALAAVLLPAAPAFAATVTDRTVLFSFNGSDTTAGPFEGSTLGGIAVDESTGSVYVSDHGHNVVDKFNAAGVAQNFSATGTSSLDGSATPQGELGLEFGGRIAVDDHGVNPGRIYVQGYIEGVGNVVNAFSPSGEYLWQLKTSSATFSNACSIGVDTEGHLWLSDSNNNLVREFANTGSPPAEIGSFFDGSFFCSLDIDVSGDVYVVRNSSEVAKFTSGVFDSILDATSGPTDVTVNQSSPTGHVFTLHSEDFREYDSSGGLVGAFGLNQVSRGEYIAYNPTLDRAYIGQFGTGRVDVFGPAITGTTPDATIEPTTAIGVSKATLNGSVNPQSVPNSYHFEWKEGAEGGWSGAQSSPSQTLAEDSSPHAVTFNATGLRGGRTYQARLVGVNTSNELFSVSSADTFETAASAAPEVTIAAPSPVAATTATVSGTVNPKEDFGTRWEVQISTDPACVADFSSKPEHKLESEANSPVAVSEELTGLLPSQHYCVQIAVENSGGSITSEVKEFTTDTVVPDQVFTAYAAPRTDTSALLNGLVNPEGSPLTYSFEYSKDGGATWIALPDQEYTGEAREQIVLGEELTELSPNAEYSYRFNAENTAGEASPQGAVKTFVTRTSAEMNPPARGIELVNNPDKGNQNVTAGGPFGTPPITADGEKALWTVKGGAPGGNTASGEPFLAERTPSGWRSHTLVPPAAEQAGGGTYAYRLEAATDDFSKFVVRAAETDSGLLLAPSTILRLAAAGGQERLSIFTKGVNESNGIAADITGNAAHVLAVNPSTGELEDMGSGSGEIVSIMPNGEPASCPIGGEVSELTVRGVQWHPSYHEIDVANASRAYFLAHPNGECGAPFGLYERNRESGETVLVDPGLLGHEVKPIRATPDGRSYYFATFSQLDPSDANTDADLYRWDEEAEESTCLTCAANPDVQLLLDGGQIGSMLVSDDFSHAYFLSGRQLVPGHGRTNGLNLYTLSGGTIKFVALLPHSSNGERVLNFNYFTPNLSTDGDVLTFRAAGGVTSDAVVKECESPGENNPSGDCWQLYRYDDRDGSVECVSCAHSSLTTRAVEASSAAPYRRDFSTSADGSTIAFVTRERLVPQDVNNGADVYEWRNGAVRLITDGVNSYAEGLAGIQVPAVDADGSNIFFTAVAPGLTGFEHDGLANFYDARIGGGFTPPGPPTHCAEDSCQGPLAQVPSQSGAGSASFAGHGNLAPAANKRCGQGKTRRGKRCVSKRSLAQRACRHRHGEAKQHCVHRRLSRAGRNK